jgi:hypothetical protein
MNEITKKLNTLVKKSGNKQTIVYKMCNVKTKSRFVDN